ncbi:hypothetical protein [Oceanobacillus kimchii]|uniref:hypothetical protein n=1 Tax=Oceanobacillus kimchii TaxID=746691 RepID=UPI003B02E702
MYTINFTESELAVIYEGVQHMLKTRDVQGKNNMYGLTAESVLNKVSEQNSKVTSAFYVSDNLIDD